MKYTTAELANLFMIRNDLRVVERYLLKHGYTYIKHARTWELPTVTVHPLTTMRIIADRGRPVVWLTNSPEHTAALVDKLAPDAQVHIERVSGPMSEQAPGAIARSGYQDPILIADHPSNSMTQVPIDPDSFDWYDHETNPRPTRYIMQM